MTSFLNRLAGLVDERPPELVCRRELWSQGARELHRRTHGETRESGAFLLGREESGAKRILDFIYYDDLDPEALSTGIVHFNGNRFTALWAICRERGYGVVADVHVHPYGYEQSTSDRDNPSMPRAGHIAIILPNFAVGTPEPGCIGLYKYFGNKRWQTQTRAGHKFFKLD